MDPPREARAQTWWHWMNGNICSNAITRDLEAMKWVGLGGAQIFNVKCSTPEGPVDFMSPEWRGLFQHAVAECDRLGLELSIHTCDGWSQSGGPWVQPEEAMQMLVSSTTRATGPGRFSAVLPQPPVVKGFYRDAFLLAYPTPAGDESTMSELAPRRSASVPLLASERTGEAEWVTIASTNLVRPAHVQFEFDQPFTCRSATITLRQADGPQRSELHVSQDGVTFTKVCPLPEPGEGYSMTHDTTAAFAPVTGRVYRVVLLALGRAAQTTFNFSLTGGARLDRHQAKAGEVARPASTSKSDFEVPPAAAIPRGKILDLTAKLDAAGRLESDVPAGNWTILRLGHTLTGRLNAQGTRAGSGLEVDKMNPDAVRRHLDAMIHKLIADSGPLAGKTFTTAHLDSWEALCANWTPAFRQEFERRRGYDPLRFLPVMTGRVVESVALSERFLWDVRRTIADLVVEHHHAVFQKEINRRGLRFQAEAFGPNLITIGDAFQAKSVVDIPMAEFWTGRETALDCKEASSSANLHGKRIVAAEAFTAVKGDWTEHPFSLKSTGDRAFCRGINRFVFHRFAHNPWPERAPGMNMGQYGINFEPSVTWWELAPAWTEYLARCQFLLQQGRAVSDVLYYVGEQTPSRLESRADLRPVLPPGYDYDGCGTGELLNLLSVEGGRLVTPSGMSYRALVLPDQREMTPVVARKVRQLVAAGALVVGPKPERAPGLSDYPACDREVRDIGNEVWGRCDGDRVTEARFGTGRVIHGRPMEAILAGLEVEPDFEPIAPTEVTLDYIHRRTDGAEIYFVCNPTNRPFDGVCTFRVLGLLPELWDAATGERRMAGAYWTQDGRTRVPLQLAPGGSVFVVFRTPMTGWAVGNGRNWDAFTTVGELSGPWTVRFDPLWGGPETVQFETLESWSRRREPGIKYYSGLALYEKSFEWTNQTARAFVDLGKVAVIAEVSLNGERLGVAWKPPYRVELTRALKPGRNVLQIRVANLWPNRLIGDEQRAEDCEWGTFTSAGAPLKAWPEWLLAGKPSPTGRFTFASWKHYQKDSPLLESGLLGPVNLQIISSK